MAILPVSNEISLPAISTETRVTASLLIFTAFLFRPSVGGSVSFFINIRTQRSLASTSGPCRAERPRRRLRERAQASSPKAAAMPARSSSTLGSSPGESAW